VKKIFATLLIALLLSSCNKSSFNISPKNPKPGETVKIKIKSDEYAVVNLHYEALPDSQMVINSHNGYATFKIPENIYYITYDIENSDSMTKPLSVLEIYTDSGKPIRGYYFAKGMLLEKEKKTTDAINNFKKETDLYPSNYDAFFENLFLTNAKINKDSIIVSLNKKYSNPDLLESTINYYYKTGNIALAQEYLNKFLQRNYTFTKSHLSGYLTYYNKDNSKILDKILSGVTNEQLKKQFILNLFYYSVMDNNKTRAKTYGNLYINIDTTSANRADVLYWMYRMKLKSINDVLPLAKKFPSSRYASRVFGNYINLLIENNKKDSAYSTAKSFISSYFLPDFIINFGYSVLEKIPSKTADYLNLINKRYPEINSFKLRNYYAIRNYDYNEFVNKKNTFYTYFYDLKSRLFKGINDNNNALKYAKSAMEHMKLTDNDDTDILDNLASLFFTTGKNNDAKSLAFKILTKSPSDSVARSIISKLYPKSNIDSIINSEINKRLKVNTLNIKADNFTIKSINGKTFSLDKLRGKVVVLNFWATWCGPCKHEIPYISKLPGLFSSDNVIFLAISDEDSTRIAKFVQTHPFKYNVCFKGNKVSEIYNIKAIPTHIIIDKKGYVQYKHIGYIPGIEKKIEMEIKLLLK